MLRQAKKELSKTDVYSYADFVFGFTLAKHHHQMVDFVLERLARGESGVILAPRGSGKTTTLNTVLLSWLVATQPDIRIGLFSQKDKKAEAMSSAIRFTLSESEPF
jgi:ABC-type multidrug transport system ATPase subunit